MDKSSLYGLALDVTTLAVLRLVKRYPASGKGFPEGKNSVELVLGEAKDLFRRFELEVLAGERELLEACFEVLRLPGVPVKVGGACGKAGLETLRKVFTDPDASVLFITSYGLDEFEEVMEELGVDPEEIRAECRRLLVQEVEYEGRVHPSEEVIESWVEAGFEVRVVGREKFEKKGVHFEVCYTDNVMAITSANMTTAGLERLRECSELVVPLVMDVKAPVALLEYEPLGFAAVVGANVHAGVLHEFLTRSDRVYDRRSSYRNFYEEYGGYLPECEGLRHLYRELRAGLEWYLREGCPEMLWWVEPEPQTMPDVTPNLNLYI